MKHTDIAPYFHPTQVVLIDNDIDFLGNLSLQLDSDLAYLLFDSTSKALNYIEVHRQSRAPRERFFRHGAGGAHDDSPTLKIDYSAIQSEMRSSERFAQVSVVMVDYAMPELDGLEFCRQIRDPHVKKILFTGVATESVAIDAFNKGVIDQYIRKQERSVYTTLNQAIRDFQKQYIRDLFVITADIFSMQTPSALEDPAIASILATLEREYGMVEYYIADDPLGFLFANAEGNIKRLVVLDETTRLAESRRLEALGLPEEGVAAVASGRSICDPGMIVGSTGTWRNLLVDPRQVNGTSNTHQWAVFPVGESGTGRVRPSYNEFLEWLDTVGYALM